MDKKTLGLVVSQDENGIIETECTYTGFNHLELLGLFDMVRDEIISDLETLENERPRVTIQ